MQRDEIYRALKGHDTAPRRSHAERLVESSKPSHRAIVAQLHERLCVVCGVGMGRLGESRTAHPWCEREGGVMEGDKMTAQMMTAQELAEARELESKATAGPWTGTKGNVSGRILGIGAPGGTVIRFKGIGMPSGEGQANARFIIAARTLVPRLLATLKALTQRAERAEAERDQAFTDLGLLLDALGYAADDDGFIDEVVARIRGIIALADARGRALEKAVRALGSASRQLPVDFTYQAVLEARGEAEAILSLTPPQALRQQQEREAELASDLGKSRELVKDLVVKWERAEAERDAARNRLTKAQEREAEKDALIERLQNWLERFGEHSDRCDVLLLDDQGRHQACSCGFDAIAYSLTPPEALREREDRVAALEAVAEAAKEYVWRNDVYCRLCEEGCTCGALAFKSSLRALDAVKGGQA